MRQITMGDTIGALCCDDHKGINNQYVDQGKVIVVEYMGRIPIWGMAEVLENRTAPAFWRNIWGGTESIVTEENKAVDAKNFTEGEVNGTITSAAGHNTESNNVVRQRYAVRRLTPTEAERLQGLPDGYTLIPDKTCSDSARYKALGNGMAQPVATWVVKRIVEEVNAEEND